MLKTFSHIAIIFTFNSMRVSIIFLFLIMSLTASAQTKITSKKVNKNFLEKLLKAHPDLFANILAHPTHNDVQIMYTQIDRDKNNVPHFRSYSYRIDPTWYFYPASTVKLPASIFALEKINELKVLGFTKKSSMITDSAFAGQTKVIRDTSSANDLPSIEHYIKKILLVSDNDAYNRLFEFIGREEINKKLHKNGLIESRILNRLAIGDNGESAKHTNPITFYNGDKVVYRKPALYDSKEYPLTLNNLTTGIGYWDSKKRLVNKPYSFADKNVFTIENQQALIKKLIFPEAFPQDQQFNLTPDDYGLLYKYMSMHSTESDYPKYNPKEFPAVYNKFLFYGSDKNAVPDPNIRIFNKYGDSYGFVIDNSYFVDFKNRVEFFLTAVVQSNDDGIYNDDKYEYESVCYPFLKNLGRVIYSHELKRKKKHLPDLNKFKFEY